MKANIYDFDKTIVPFDSGSLFCGYCFLHYPWTMLYIPIIIINAILMIFRVISFTEFKRSCFKFLKYVPVKKAVKGFWDKHEKQVHKWFYDREGYTIVISASPDFLLEDISKRLGFDTLICTRHSEYDFAIIGENCRGEEKVRRLYEIFDKNSLEILEVYSDSLKHDQAIFSLGKKCFHIVKGQKILFNYDEVYSFERDGQTSKN